jgi:hypothetical protein
MVRQKVVVDDGGRARIIKGGGYVRLDAGKEDLGGRNFSTGKRERSSEQARPSDRSERFYFMGTFLIFQHGHFIFFESDD